MSLSAAERVPPLLGWRYAIRLPDLVFVSLLSVICAVTAYVGLPTLRLFAHDAFFLLDNAYRVLQGQVPHRDFSSAWGPVMFLIDAVGLRLAGMRPDGLGYANAFFGGLIAIWTFAVARPRVAPTLACVGGLGAALLITAPYPLGFSVDAFSAAMVYNRYGYALFGIVVLECAVDIFAARDCRPARLAAASTGVALALLTFLKISFVIAVPFVAACALLAGGRQLPRLVTICLAFLGTSILLIVAVPISLSGMMRDLAMAFEARRNAPELINLAVAPLFLQVAPLAILALLIGREPDRPLWHSDVIRGLLLATLVIASGTAIIATNFQPSGFPLNGYAAIVIVAIRNRHVAVDRVRMTLRAIFFVLCQLPLVSNATSLLAAANLVGTPTMPVVLATPGVPQMSFGRDAWPPGTPIDGPVYVRALDDGLRLLQRRSQPDEGVLAFDMFNPFNYLLGRPSPLGGMAAFADNYVFNEASHPSADQVFGSAQIIIERKYPVTDDQTVDMNYWQDGLRRVYGADLAMRFRVVEETENWVLWRRR